MKTSDIIRVPEIENEFLVPGNYEEIKADIASRGIQESIVVNSSGQLLCGYTRLSIAEDLGIEEIPHRTVDITGTGAMIEYAILDNIRRRQLTDLQVVEYGLQLEEIYGKRQGERSDLGSSCPEVGKGRTRDMVAAKIKEATGVRMSGEKYGRLKTIARKAIPAVKQAVIDGRLSQEAALKLVKLGDGAEQRKFLELARGKKETIGIRDVEIAIVKEKRRIRRESVREFPVSLNPPVTGGRTATVRRLVHEDTKEVRYELCVGPTQAGVEIQTLYEKKQGESEYQIELSEVEKMLKHASDLRKEADKLEDKARELEAIIEKDIYREIEDEYGDIEPFAETYFIEVTDPELAILLGKEDASQIADILLSEWDTGKFEVCSHGLWGDISYLGAKTSPILPCAGWTGIGSADNVAGW